MADGKPIIIIKKKGGHGGHHGGAWKIAYADFVTAMMSFFMVMWLVNTASVVTKENIASYFRRPGIFDTGSGTPLLIGQSGILEDAFTPSTKFKAGTQGGKNDVEKGGERGEEEGQLNAKGGEEKTGTEQGKAFAIPEVKGVLVDGIPTPAPTPPDQAAEDAVEAEYNEFQEAAGEIRTLVAGSPELQDLLGIVDVKVDADGLNIEVIDTEKTSMFLLGSARVLPETETAFSKLAGIIAKLDNSIDIVGHTDAKKYAGSGRGYSNWELSADRANAARRILQAKGVDVSRINSVVGMADKLLKDPSNPVDASNRRISLKIRFRQPAISDLSPDSVAARLEKQAQAKSKKREAAFARDLAKTNSPTANQKSVTDPATTVKALPSPTPDETHIFTPKEIIKAARKQHDDRVKLPPDTRKPSFTGKSDKIFSDIPVIGPGDPFNF